MEKDQGVSNTFEQSVTLSVEGVLALTRAAQRLDFIDFEVTFEPESGRTLPTDIDVKQTGEGGTEKLHYESGTVTYTFAGNGQKPVGQLGAIFRHLSENYQPRTKAPDDPQAHE